MKFLTIMVATLCAAAATMALLMAVVALLLWLNLALRPSLASQLPALVQAAAVFAVLAAVTGVALRGLWMHRHWAPLAAGVSAAVAAVAVRLLVMLFS